jgi:hypothetical protein
MLALIAGGALLFRAGRGGYSPAMSGRVRLK